MTARIRQSVIFATSPVGDDDLHHLDGIVVREDRPGWFTLEVLPVALALTGTRWAACLSRRCRSKNASIIRQLSGLVNARPPCPPPV